MLNFGLDPFILKLVLSFFVGAVWITLATTLAEKYGSKIGGVLIGLPSTILISLFFIAWTQGLQLAVRATDIVPIIEAIDVLFIVIYILLLRYHFITALTCSFLFWFVSSLSLVLYGFDEFWLSIFLLITIVALAYNLFEKRYQVTSTKRCITHNSLWLLLTKAFLSGGIIAFSVLMSKWGGPLLGGAFAAFPAAYSSTMIITYFTHGKEFSAAVMKSLMLSGGINITVYVVAVRYAYTFFGLLQGTLLAFSISLLSGYLTYLFVQKKMS